MTSDHPQLDLNSEFVQIEIREDGKVLWVHNEDGLTVLRISGIESIEFVDHRYDADGNYLPTRNIVQEELEL